MRKVLFQIALLHFPVFLYAEDPFEMTHSIGFMIGASGFSSKSSGHIPAESFSDGSVYQTSLQFDSMLSRNIALVNSIQIGRMDYKNQSSQSHDYNEEGSGIDIQYELGLKLIPNFARWFYLQGGVGINLMHIAYKMTDVQKDDVYFGGDTPISGTAFGGLGFLIPLKMGFSAQLNTIYRYIYGGNYAKGNELNFNIGVSYQL